MQTEDSQKVVRRFFEALYRLKDDGKIRGKQTFTREFDINRWNLNKLEKNLASDIFQPAWLTYIVKEYKVSARWLLTGEGDFYETRTGAKPCSCPRPLFLVVISPENIGYHRNRLLLFLIKDFRVNLCC